MLMAAAFLVVIAPNARWLVDSGFLPMRYVTDARKDRQRTGTSIVTYPGFWLLSQAFFIFPTLILLGLMLFPRRPAADNASAPRPTPSRAAMSRCWRRAVAVVTTIATVTGPGADGAMGLSAVAVPAARRHWSFGSDPRDPQRKQIFAAGSYFPVLLGTCRMDRVPMIADPYFADTSRGRPVSGADAGEPYDRDMAQKPETPLSPRRRHRIRRLTRVAVYSPDRPHVIVHGRPEQSVHGSTRTS